MSNPFSGIITSELQTLYENAIDSLLEDSALTVTCRITYGTTKWTECDNCVLDPIGRKSSNRYKSGGPAPFNHGTCPICKGEGFIPSDQTTTIDMMPIWDSNSWIDKLGNSVKSPMGTVQTLSKLTTLDEIKKAKSVVIDTSIEDYVKARYVREGEPELITFGSKNYVLTTWSKSG